MNELLRIDPVTRIEGHLSIEVKIKGGTLVDAWSSGTLFRGIEKILVGRDPLDAPTFVQRSCGVCTYVHCLASTRAVEDAIGVTIPKNARIIRNMLHGAQMVVDHIVHFYHLHALDWVDVVSALKADPAATAKLSANTTGDSKGGTTYFKQVQDRLKKFVESGQLGPFANAYWGSPAYKLPPEGNLMATAHYIEALRVQTTLSRMQAIFGAKTPHLETLVAGGVTCVRDLTPDRIAEFKFMWKELQAFVQNVYIPDLLTVASFYKDWAGIGKNVNFLAYGDFPQSADEPDSFFMPRGRIADMGMSVVKDVDFTKITEDVTRAWYEGEDAKHPYDGETNPKPGKYDREGKYSWLKAPRYEGEAYEVGPLASVLVAYAKGQKQVRAAVNHVLKTLDVPATALFSTLGRTAARGIQTLVIVNEMENWINDLVANIKGGDLKTYTPWKMPDKAKGVGLNDVARGSLGHWIEIEGGKIKNYQYVVPSTWNFGPRCSSGKLGPVERALINTPIIDPKKTVEVLRTVHSFDPCIACAVHVVDMDNNESHKARIC